MYSQKHIIKVSENLDQGNVETEENNQANLKEFNEVWNVDFCKIPEIENHRGRIKEKIISKK